MTFQINEYAYATGIPYVLGALILILLVRGAHKYRVKNAKKAAGTLGKVDQPKLRKQLRRECLEITVVYVVAALVINLLAFLISTQKDNPYSTTRYVAQGFGLISGKQYPLKLGPVFAGNSADVTTTGGKSKRTTVRVNADPVVSVSFTQGSNTYLLEIPLAKITFHQSTTRPPSMVLRLKNIDYDGATIKNTYSDCTFVVHNFFTTCEKHRTKQVVTINNHARRLGLALVVQAGLSSADFTLTPTMYASILGR